MIDKTNAPAELSAEEIEAVSGGTGYFGSGHREGGGGTIGSGT
jgi:hypothetical protein